VKPIDVHTHLSSTDFDADRPDVVARALETCDAFIDIGSGTSVDAFFKSKKLAESNEKVFFTAGIHPHDAEALSLDGETLKAIEEIVKHPKCVAVGECGLDYHYEHSPKDRQAQVFDWHKKLATRAGLPLMIHTREAEEDTMTMLSQYSGSAIFHCFTGTKKLADFGVSKGFFVSFSGIVTFKTASDLREIFLNLPIENILIETDSPYLAPIPMRGKRNETSFISHTARFLAELRGMPLETFVSATRSNSLRAFPKLKIQT